MEAILRRIRKGKLTPPIRQRYSRRNRGIAVCGRSKTSRLICDSQDSTLQSRLSDGVATVRRFRRKEERKLVLTPDYVNNPRIVVSSWRTTTEYTRWSVCTRVASRTHYPVKPTRDPEPAPANASIRVLTSLSSL